MNELNCWITRRYNGLYLVTAFRPVIREVAGTGHDDAYIKYGDPVGYINIPYDFGVQMFNYAPQDKVVPQRGTLYGSINGPATHVIEYDRDTDLYTIYQDSHCYIPNLCSWFVRKMFGIIKLYHIQPVAFCGMIK